MIVNQIAFLKTIYYNLKLFKFRDAMKLPLIIGRHTKVELKRGDIILRSEAKPGLITFGIGGSPDLYCFESHKNYLGVKDGGKIEFEGKAHFAIHTSCYAAGGGIFFGDKFSSNVGCRFSSAKGIEIGAECLVGGNVVIRDSDGHKVFDCLSNGKKRYHEGEKPVIIGKHVWIGNNVSILKGVTIGDGCIVGYGTVVVKPVKDTNCLIGGVTGTVIKREIEWQR